MSTSVPQSGECQACLEEGVELVTLSCQHASYCSDCTVEQFRNIREVIRPQCPQCDENISLDTVKSILPEDLYANVQAKLLEFEIPGPSRLYCPNTACTKFIHPSMLAKPTPSNDDLPDQLAGLSIDPSSTSSQTQCPYCAVKICQNCKKLVHEGECVDEFEETKEVANPANSKQCPMCGNLVERKDGCQHMSCDCGHQFCILCAADWSDCKGSCPGSTADANANHGANININDNIAQPFTIRQIINLLHVYLVLERPYLEHLDGEHVNDIVGIIQQVVDFANLDTADLNRQAPLHLWLQFVDLAGNLQRRGWPIRPIPLAMFHDNQIMLEAGAYIPLRQFAINRFLNLEAAVANIVRDLWRRGADPEERRLTFLATRALLLTTVNE